MAEINSKTMKVTAFEIGGPRNCVASSHPSTTHSVYTAASCRIREVWDNVPNDPLKVVAPMAGATVASFNDPNGPMYYLPYEQNKIFSMVLPGNPPATCRKFITANMSGCRFYIDRILGSTDIVVYHANTTQHGSAPDAGANAQSAAASNILNQLHHAAQGDYRNQGTSTVPVGELIKHDYLMPGESAVLRKISQGRTDTAPIQVPNPASAAHPLTQYTPGQRPTFMGGTTIFGEWNGSWHFYYQTFGYVSYDRKVGKAEFAKSLATLHWNRAHKTRMGEDKGSTQTKVVKFAQFF